MNDTTAVIVYGPTGCGKTRNAHRIAAYLGYEIIIDEWTADDPITPNALHLTTLTPDRFPAGVKVLSYTEVMQVMKEREQQK